MRLLHVASSYPLNDGDEHAPFMEEMLQALTERGHDVTILVPRVEGLKEGRRNGVEVIGVPYAPTSMQVWGYGRSLDSNSKLRPTAIAVTPMVALAMARALRRQIRQSHPDIVHLHWMFPQGALALLTPKDTPVVVSIHGADVRYATGRLAPLTPRVVDRAQSIIAASSGVIDAVARIAPSIEMKAVVIPHGANTELFYPRDQGTARAELGIKHEGPLVLAVGRLVPKKGFLQLILAMESLSDIPAHLHLVGEGPELPILESAVSSGVRGYVHFEGSQSRSSVAQWIAASDVVVIPSVPDRADIDSGPVVLMEALASGRRVIASRVGMARDLITFDNSGGVILDHVDPESLAEAIRTTIGSRGEYSEGARRSFELVGGWDRVALSLETCYASILHRDARDDAIDP
jgi:glycosyltransferase involved in cell wall biosynthesis